MFWAIFGILEMSADLAIGLRPAGLSGLRFATRSPSDVACRRPPHPAHGILACQVCEFRLAFLRPWAAFLVTLW